MNDKDLLKIKADSDLSGLLNAFETQNAIRCSYCTKGMLLRANKLIKNNPGISRKEIIAGMKGYQCRCGAYDNIIDAIEMAAILRRKKKTGTGR